MSALSVKAASKTMRSVSVLSIVWSIALAVACCLMLLKKEYQARLDSMKLISGLLTSFSSDQMEKVVRDLFATKALVTISHTDYAGREQIGQWVLESSLSAASTFARAQDSRTERDLFIKIQWQTPFAMTGDSLAWMTILGLPLVLFMLTTTITWVIQKRLVIPSLRRIQELSHKAAEAHNMQMFAHDIRKPFSALKAMIDLFHREQDNDNIRLISKKLLPELDAMLLHVDGMIQDVMKKQTLSPEWEAVSVDRLLVSSIREAARRHPKATHRLTWQLRHSLKPAALEKPMIRSLANIFCNAIEATDSKDCIWVETKDSELNATAAVEITIGNSGSVIPDDVLANLFDSYFTSGKKEGTGLGLAYVKKTIDSMSGQITVRSSMDHGTEFILTLPSVPVLDKPTTPLPAVMNEHEAPSDHNRKQDEVVTFIRETLTKKGRGPLRVLVVEDEKLYFDAIFSTMPQNQAEEQYCVFDHALDYDEAITMVADQSYDIVICDVDLGQRSASGLEVVKYIVHQGKGTSIYMHTNKKMNVNDSRYVETSTNGFLSKPVPASTLLKIALDHAVNTPPMVQIHPKKPKVAIIDDDCFVRELWSLQVHDIDPHLFDSPESFLAAVKNDSDLLTSFDAIIIDYYFDSDSGITGDLLAQKIRGMVQVPIIMSSDVTHLPAEATAAFDARIEKSCFSWPEVTKRLVQ